MPNLYVGKHTLVPLDGGGPDDYEVELDIEPEAGESLERVVARYAHTYGVETEIVQRHNVMTGVPLVRFVGRDEVLVRLVNDYDKDLV